MNAGELSAIGRGRFCLFHHEAHEGHEGFIDFMLLNFVIFVAFVVKSLFLIFAGLCAVKVAAATNVMEPAPWLRRFTLSALLAVPRRSNRAR